MAILSEETEKLLDSIFSKIIRRVLTVLELSNASAEVKSSIKSDLWDGLDEIKFKVFNKNKSEAKHQPNHFLTTTKQFEEFLKKEV